MADSADLPGGILTLSAAGFLPAVARCVTVGAAGGGHWFQAGQRYFGYKDRNREFRLTRL